MQFPCSDALSYSHLAEGKIDVVIQSVNQIWDIYPLIPIIKAAGGIVTTWKNEKVPFYPKGIKSLKDAKKFLYNFNDLVVLRVLTKEILLMENITDYINGLFSD